MNIGFEKTCGFWSRVSLKLKIALLVTSLTAGLTLVVATLLIHFFESQIKGNIYQQQFSLVSALAENIDDKLILAQESITAVAPQAGRHIFDPESAQTFLDQSYGLKPLFDRGLFLFALDGTLVAESPYFTDRRGKNFGFREYHSRTIASGQPVISAPYLSSKDGSPPSIMFTAPVRDQNGDLVGVLGGAVSLLGDNFLADIREIQIGGSGYVYIYDTDRTLIVHPDKTRVMQRDVPVGANLLFDRALTGFEGTGETVTSRGKPVLASFRRLKSTNWIVAANYPAAEAFASVERVKTLVFASLVPLALMLLSATLFLIHRLLQPLEALTARVRGLTPGQTVPPALSPAGLNEITVLEEAFQGFVAQSAHDQALLLEAKNQAEAERAKTEAIIAGIGDPLTVHDREFRILYQNQAAIDLFGENLGRTCYQTLYCRSGPCPECALAKAFASGEVYSLERQTRIGERTVYLDISASPIRDASGQVVAGVEILRDISTRKKSEQHLRKLSLAIEQSPSLVMIMDPSFVIEYINPKYSDVTGFPLEELVDRSAEELSFTDEEEMDRIWGTLCSGQSWQGELCVRKKGGELFYEMAAIAPLTDEKGNTTHFVKVAEDITERRAMEQQLRQAHKMEAIGQLAGGIAHDFNNLLTAIIGYASAQQFKAEDGSRLKLDMEGIIAAASRGTKLTQDLLAFSRKRPTASELDNPALHDLNQIITQDADLLRDLLGEEIELRLQLSREKLLLFTNRQPLVQVLLNLTTNARDAMPQGGRLHIRTAAVDQDPYRLALQGLDSSGRFALLAVTDSGCGIDQASLGRIFEPFFTTKEVGKGTGLGLSIAYGIVKQHKGYMTCDSQPGQGTTFSIFLPLEESRGSTIEVREQPPPKPLGAENPQPPLAESRG